MAKYSCPVKTCNVAFEGAEYDIVPRAILHAKGSHQTEMVEEDVKEEIRKQAQPPKPEEEKKIDLEKWWKKINEK